jgi:flagellar M-ring protein FliF
VTKPLTDDEMAKINALVREAIGFNKERGDSVNVMNSPFVTEARTVVDVPWWQRAETQDLARTVAWPAGMLLLGLLVTFGLVRPAIKQAMRPPVVIQQQAEPGLDALVSEAPERPPLLTAETDSTTPPPTPQQLRLEDAKSLARSNPVAVANIVKTWVNGEAPA